MVTTKNVATEYLLTSRNHKNIISFSESTSLVTTTTLYQQAGSKENPIPVFAAYKLGDGARRFLLSAFMPKGFPTSVSRDYTSYQIFDTLQAFMSTINSIISTRCIFKGVGVGDEMATATSAMWTWVFNDGTSMMGNILFAWKVGSRLDSDVKTWRFMADIFNDLGTCLDILSIWIPKSLFLPCTCIGTFFKAITGVAGGATKSSLTQHFAIQDNVADVSAKDGSQETVVRLTGLIVGAFIVDNLPEQSWLIWVVFFICTSLHLIFNYLGVSSVSLPTINRQRFEILFNYFQAHRKIMSVEDVSSCERILYFPSGKILLGCQLSTCLKQAQNDVTTIIDLYKYDKYLLSVNLKTKKVFISISNEMLQAEELMKMYYNALITQQLLKLPPASATEVLQMAHEKTDKEFNLFLIALKEKGWNTSRSLLEPGDWRYEMISKKIE